MHDLNLHICVTTTEINLILIIRFQDLSFSFSSFACLSCAMSFARKSARSRIEACCEG